MIENTPHDKAFTDVLLTGVIGAVLAATFQAIKAARSSIGEEFDARHFTAGLISAGGVGALTAWTLDALDINREISAVIIAMMGYVGGALLDILAAEIKTGAKEIARNTRHGIEEKMKGRNKS